MRDRKHRRKIARILTTLLPMAVATVVSMALYSGLFEDLEFMAVDLRLRNVASGDAAPVAFGTLDQNSLKSIGQWPIPRGQYVRALKNILDDGAKAVLMDIDFSSRGPDPLQDEELARFIATAGKVVLAVQMEEETNPEGAIIRNVSLPLPELAGAALSLGSLTFQVDPDGRIRRIPDPIDFIDTVFQPLGIVGATLVDPGAATGIPRESFITFSENNLKSHPMIPFNRIIDGQFMPGTFRDRIVLLGATSADLHDFWSTPIGVIPGIFIQASVLETCLNGSWSYYQSFWPTVVTLFIAALLLSRLMADVGWRMGSLYTAGYFLFVAGASVLLLRAQLMIHVVPLLVLGLVQYPVQIILHTWRTEKKLEFMNRKADTILKFAELEAADEAGKEPYLVPLVLLRQVLGLNRIILYLIDEDSLGGWRVESVLGEEEVLEEYRENTLHKCIEKGQMLFFPGDEADETSVYVPMLTSRRAVGVLYAQGPGESLRDEEDVRLLLSHATQASYFLEARQLDSSVKSLYSSTIKAIIKAIDTKDHYTSAHSELSLEYVEKLGLACGLNRMEVEALHIGALLHDIGKIGVPDGILAKDGPLTPKEFEKLKEHPVMGYDIIVDLPFPEEVKLIIRHHHEHFDGSGYPDGLKGEQIPRLVRIFSVLDTYEAIVGNRPYKTPGTPESAKKLIMEASGTQFDPEIVRIFFQIV